MWLENNLCYVHFCKKVNDEIKHIIEGTGRFAEGSLIQTALVYLRKSQRAGGTAEETELFLKKDEAIRLNVFAEERNLWYTEIDPDWYIGEGAEQRVYLEKDGQYVIKLEDLHDENVLTNKRIFFFIDTVIYLMK